MTTPPRTRYPARMVNHQLSTPPAPARIDHAAKRNTTMNATTTAEQRADYWQAAAESNHADAQTYKRQRDEWHEEARRLASAATQSAPIAEVHAAADRAEQIITEWANAASIGTTRAKCDAADGIALNLANLRNFSRAEAIGFADALLRHFADTTGLTDYAGFTDAEISRMTTTAEDPEDCAYCSGNGSPHCEHGEPQTCHACNGDGAFPSRSGGHACECCEGTGYDTGCQCPGCHASRVDDDYPGDDACGVCNGTGTIQTGNDLRHICPSCEGAGTN